jgi:hypothetical protein
MDITHINWPADIDPIRSSLHQGQHCLFFNPSAPYNHIKIWQTLTELCDEANRWIQSDGIDGFIADARNHFNIANLVKINLWSTHIRQQGIKKPILILHHGDGHFDTGVGESRIKIAQRISGTDSVPAFLATRAENAHLFADWMEITTFDQFANCCAAQPGDQFLFRLESHNADYGISWYEYNSPFTRSVGPSDDVCVSVFETWYKHNNIFFTPNWFDQSIDWESYGLVV